MDGGTSGLDDRNNARLSRLPVDSRWSIAFGGLRRILKQAQQRRIAGLLQSIAACLEQIRRSLDAVAFEQTVHEIEQADREDRVVQIPFGPAFGKDGIDMSLQGLGGDSVSTLA